MKKEDAPARSILFSFCYTPMQEVTPKVVAIAVNTVMTMWRIFPQTDLFSIVMYQLTLHQQCIRVFVIPHPCQFCQMSANLMGVKLYSLSNSNSSFLCSEPPSLTPQCELSPTFSANP